jgi:hypothetical protein
MTNVERPTVSRFEHHRDVPEGRLWFGILAAPAAWIAQGALGWFFGYRVCTSMSIASVRTTLSIISLLAIGMTLAGLITGWRNYRQFDGDIGVEAWDRVAFMSLAGVFVSAAFLVGSIWAGLTPVLLDSCGGMR